MFTNTLTLAAVKVGNKCLTDTGQNGSELPDVMCSDLWTSVIVPIGATVAVVAVLVGIFMMVKNFLSARPGGVAKSLGLTIMSAAFLMNLEWIARIIDIGAKIADYVINLFSGMIG